jgi:hypothetical protein
MTEKHGDEYRIITGRILLRNAALFFLKKKLAFA